MNQCGRGYLLAYGEWLEGNLFPPVLQRQYMIALPKLIRPFFRYRRRYLDARCRLVAGLLKAGGSKMPEALLLNCVIDGEAYALAKPLAYARSTTRSGWSASWSMI